MDRSIHFELERVEGIDDPLQIDTEPDGSLKQDHQIDIALRLGVAPSL